ncbi:hypothetical protein WMY93_003250 [Mugilogobius chulae]|uniref:Integrase catalytic domain-containing protein n=1 Tax=Mugilogobius chulae TaxID=88201 RepID=A0AAW0PYT6_9GOBI
MDILPYRNEKLITRSKQDTVAIRLLEEKTVRVQIDGIQRYATPLLWKGLPPLTATKEAVIGHLRGTESRLLKDPAKAASYNQEVRKLLDSGYIRKISSAEEQSISSWYIPHHMVHHNGKDRIVFNCSFTFQNNSLNEHLLPGPTLGSTLLGVLLRFREYPIAVSSDIKGMFHQVRLLPEDQPFLRFIWRDMNRSVKPDIYQWQHVLDHSRADEDTRHSVENCFYVDNLLQSFPSAAEAKPLVTKLQNLLQSGGFELRQWATNTPAIISHMPPELTSESTELWLSMDGTDPPERTLGLHWHCKSDTITYRLRHTDQPPPTMRNIYRVLARQYDPLGLLIPYTTRAKILVQRLWGKKRDWDDPHLPEDLLHLWNAWVSELHILPNISINRCYVHSDTNLSSATQSIHIFSDASERAYGSVAYLHTIDSKGAVQVAFLAARSRVAPVRQQSIPRLELCAAHTGAQLGAVLKRELSVPISSITYWTDSTTVLNWLQSPSCRYKVFVGARVADIQELTESSSWRYVHSTENPADDITRGLTLSQIQSHSRWKNGPSFLYESESSWPSSPNISGPDDPVELRKAKFCGLVTIPSQTSMPDASQFTDFKELLNAAVQACHGAALDAPRTAESFRQAELSSLDSRLLTLAPEYDSETQLIRVGGRLRRCDSLSSETLHPIVLDSHHPITKLIIADYDSKLAHPGPERVFAELRRRYWILRGREAVRKHQHHCSECQKWRGQPIIPKMADLPPSSLRLHQPAFYSTGMDCFGPFLIKIGRRNEKRWGIIFKCLTTHAVYLDLLASMDTDSFLMSLRRFISRRGKPHELLSDQGTNFKGGSSELHEAFNSLAPELQSQLASQQIHFRFNPPSAPHFGGSWEREIRSIKSALHAMLGSQTVTEEVLRTVLTEVENIINSKPLGYTSSDVADPDPITPNMLLMGRLDPCTPQVVYPATELLSRRRWRHSQALSDQFWIHFIRNYLPSLQSRSKWQQDREDICVDDIVLIVDQQHPRALWLVGKVTRVFPGVDGRIRSCQVQTTHYTTETTHYTTETTHYTIETTHYTTETETAHYKTETTHYTTETTHYTTETTHYTTETTHYTTETETAHYKTETTHCTTETTHYTTKTTHYTTETTHYTTETTHYTTETTHYTTETTHYTTETTHYTTETTHYTTETTHYTTKTGS